MAKVQRELASYRVFSALSQELVEVNEQICEARPVPVGPPEAVPAVAAVDVEKGGSTKTSKRSSRPR